MIDKKKLEKISDVLWEIPKSHRSDMRVPARIWATEAMLEQVFSDRTIEQLINVSTLPGIQKAALVMPDAHEGYGFPIGGIAATEYPDGVISPGGIGYDINCGVRLLKSTLSFDDVRASLESLGRYLFREIPSGVGRGGAVRLGAKEFDRMLKRGVSWAIESGYGSPQDVSHIESAGYLEHADPDACSDHAKKRGRNQLGTMGAGNHFVEVGRVDQILDEQATRALGLFRDQITVLIHTGSRGFGHQVATDHIRTMMSVMPKYSITLPDRELACVPLSSKEGQSYFGAMAAAAHFAWCNRQLITWEVRGVFERAFGKQNGILSILYDVAHNIAKIEKHEIDGVEKKVIVHRKGATRAFGPGHPELAEEYRAVGQPVIIPGSMGTASYILVGTNEGMKESFGSSCHGAGRRMSRHAARRKVRGELLQQELSERGIFIQAGSHRGLVEEAPLAYKDIHDVVDVVDRAGIAKKVARLRPLVVVKG